MINKISTMLVVLVFVAGASGAHAVPIIIEFDGTVIDSSINPNFVPLLSGGDAVSGSVEFDFSVQPATSGSTLGGSYTVPAGTVSGYEGGLFAVGAIQTGFDFRENGTGPSTTNAAGDLFTLVGFSISFDINGFSAPLSDFLALDVTDVQFLDLIGKTQTATGLTSSGGVAEVDVTAVSFRLASIPEPPALALMAAGLAGLGIARRKKLAIKH